MSSSIWMECGGDSNLRRLELDAWRAVEAQHRVATRKLVDSDAAQQVLESLIEAHKPPLPEGVGRLHYLLFTPFRYPPLRHGSRFGTRLERGLWYGAEGLRTAFAEVAYYRLLFLEGTDAELAPLEVDLTAFWVRVRTPRGVDLDGAPFDRHRARLTDPARYDETQALGAAMRAAGVEAFRYRSARDRDGGANVGLFAPGAFASRTPRDPQTWHCIAAREWVEMARRSYFAREVHRFERAWFLVDGALPEPA